MDKDIAQNSLHKLQYINQLAKITLFKTIIPNIFINRTFKRDYPSSSHVIAKASPHSSLGGVLSHVIASEAWQSPKDRLLKIATAPRDLAMTCEVAGPRNNVQGTSLAMTCERPHPENRTKFRTGKHFREDLSGKRLGFPDGSSIDRSLIRETGLNSGREHQC